MANGTLSMEALHGHETVSFARMMQTAYLNYAVETIKDRALPDVRDGLKPVHRRILYAMYDMGLRSTAKHRKSARVVGDVLGKYHPHGDTAVYDAMVRMAQDFAMRAPLIDGQGNFGSIDGDGAAAMRYTEARMAAIADELLADLKADTVAWQDNFDNTLQEPVVLPAKFPNLLVNGSEGIAVGMACKIPPHNLGEVCDAVEFLAKNWTKRSKITVDDLMKFVKGPDFPTGGIIYRLRSEGEAEIDTIRQAYETGRGKITVQGLIAGEDSAGHPISDLSSARRLVISQIPYGLTKSTLLAQIAEAVRKERIKGITDLRDESDYEGMRVVISIMRGYTAEEVLASLLSKTSLKQTYGVISLALVEGEPEYLSLKRILELFIEHRLEVITRRTRYELGHREARLHLVEGLLKALANIDDVIDTIRRSRTQETAKANLRKKFKLSEAQTQAILDMQLRRLAALERQKLETEKRELKTRIRYLKGLLASKARRLAVVVEETTEIRQKYATPRQTVILDHESDSGVVTEADLLLPDGPQVVAATTNGNIIRVKARGFSGRQTKGLTKRAVDAPLFFLRTGPEDTVIFVSSHGRVWRGPVYRVPDKVKLAEFGLKRGETIVGAGLWAEDKFLTMVASNGKVKRTRVVDLSGSEGNWNTALGGLSAQDRVVVGGLTDGKAEVMLFTANGKALRFKEDAVNPQASNTATGVAAIKLGKDDALIGGNLVLGDRAAQCVVIVSEKGWAKRVALKEFPIQGRGGQGVQTLRITGATGRVAAASLAWQKGSLNVMSGRGLRYHLATAKLPRSNRANRGKQLFNFGKDDVIAQVV
ncbi:MAG: DNA topoisomerase (ATP-hydrolyzing) subunit A, partial [Anaerolineae bacterium]